MIKSESLLIDNFSKQRSKYLLDNLEFLITTGIQDLELSGGSTDFNSLIGGDIVAFNRNLVEFPTCFLVFREVLVEVDNPATLHLGGAVAMNHLGILWEWILKRPEKHLEKLLRKGT